MADKFVDVVAEFESRGLLSPDLGPCTGDGGCIGVYRAYEKAPKEKSAAEK